MKCGVRQQLIEAENRQNGKSPNAFSDCRFEFPVKNCILGQVFDEFMQKMSYPCPLIKPTSLRIQ
jgi:hypothetical protein